MHYLTAIGLVMMLTAGPVGAADLTAKLIFKKLGWEVYDRRTADLEETVPKETLQYTTTAHQFKAAFNANDHKLRAVFSAREIVAIKYLIDGSISNDEMKFTFVTPKNRASISAISADKSVGEQGWYVIRKSMSAAHAQRLRMISPKYK